MIGLLLKIQRLGGKEFAMVLPSTAAAEALELSQRLHAAINKTVLNFYYYAIRYNANIGLTEFGTASEGIVDALAASADLALYQARQAGRNQTVSFNPRLTRAAAG